MKIERSRISIPYVEKEVAEAISKGELVYGPHIDLLRSKFSTLGKDKFFDFTANGFSALFVAIKAQKIANKKIVIPFPQTCMALISTIRASGNEVLFSDCQTSNPNLDLEKLNDTIHQNEEVAAIISPAYFGIYEPIVVEDQNIVVIEDLCQAILTYSKEDLAPTQNCRVFSFYPSKNLIGIDGGCIASNREYLSTAIKKLSSYSTLKEDDGDIHFNLKLNNLSALLANSDFTSLEEKSEKRTRLWKSFVSLFDKSENIDLITSVNNSWVPFKALVKLKDKDSRDAFITEMNQEFEIEASTELNASNNGLKEEFPNSKMWIDQSCSVPFYEGMSERELEYLISSISSSDHF